VSYVDRVGEGDAPKRKPRGKTWESWIEQQIREAQGKGEFDNLPGAGKPLPDIDQPYDPDWWAKQFMRREQLSLLPPALELLRKVESEVAALWSLGTEAGVRTRVAAINAQIAKVNAKTTQGPRTRLAPMDVDVLVADWRRRRESKEKA
jgi:DnaJ-like protein